jgi:ribosomal protein L30E
MVITIIQIDVHEVNGSKMELDNLHKRAHRMLNMNIKNQLKN